jgi:metal-responsive CopG/Arc/MetJ family transcriptional regulator
MATNPIPNTAMLSIRLDADALAALDSFAVGRGGRSAVVRQMIEQSVQEIADRPHIDPMVRRAIVFRCGLPTSRLP